MKKYLRPDMILNYIFIIVIVATIFVGDSALTQKVCLIAICYVIIKPVFVNVFDGKNANE